MMTARPMELRDTISNMVSLEYKERFEAEYCQLAIRHGKLKYMIERYEEGTLDFTPSCSIELLKEQEKCMEHYLRCLKMRAEIEDIILPK